MSRTGFDIRKGIEQNWHEYLSKYANLFSSNEIQGSSPPSVFVGSYGSVSYTHLTLPTKA